MRARERSRFVEMMFQPLRGDKFLGEEVLGRQPRDNEEARRRAVRLKMFASQAEVRYHHVGW